MPSLAALKLLDHVAGSGGRIHYCGDFDVKGLGLEMAVHLQRRYGDRWMPRHPDAETYAANVHPNAPLFDEKERQDLQRLQVKIASDRQLVPAMPEHGRKLFQEQVPALSGV